MPRLPLTIVRGAHPPSLALGHPVEAVRLIAELSLRTADNWTLLQPVVVDTGAPISLLPRSIWAQAQYVSHGRTFIGGITARPECRIPALLAEVECVLSSGSVTLGPLRIDAYLAEVDQSPALLGISGFIRQGKLHVHIDGNEAYVELS